MLLKKKISKPISLIGKKIKVVNAVIRDLQLTNVKPVNLRADQIKGTFDFVVSRAVTKFENFLPWVDKKIIYKYI